MSGLYQYFVTTVLLVAIAMFSTIVFYPLILMDHSVSVQEDAVNRTYMYTLHRGP